MVYKRMLYREEETICLHILLKFNGGLDMRKRNIEKYRISNVYIFLTYKVFKTCKVTLGPISYSSLISYTMIFTKMYIFFGRGLQAIYQI